MTAQARRHDGAQARYRGGTERVRCRRQPAGGQVPLEPFDDPVHAPVLEVPSAEPQEHLRREPRQLPEGDGHVVWEPLELAAKQPLTRRLRELRRLRQTG